ncbi:MAG: hypothetical protein M3335_04025, partial [Actinomycetota bacterium]|nr:hypothetical protein [Actinomycetota bacterium]
MKGEEAKEKPEAQGQRFEETLAELFTRLIRDDLGLTLIDLISQSRGSQGGRDLQVRWESASGKIRFWHFECKSHAKGVIPLKEVSDKLLQEALSPHDIDVWCLACAAAEPANGFDDLINAAPQALALDFALTAISPSREGLKWLYACHPDLYWRQYGCAPSQLTPREREHCIERCGQWLEEWSEKRPRGGPSGWTRVTPSRVGSVPDLPREARAYLRGLTVTCPWPAVVHDWAVPRREIETSLFALVEEMEPGLDYEWLISAGGEGKSTLLRRLAWRVANDQPEITVLWADEERPAAVAVDWLERLPAGSRVLLCVDGTTEFSGLRDGLNASGRLAERNIGVLVVMADRGTLWRNRRLQQRFPSRARKPPLTLPPLSSAEREELLVRLESRGLLLEAARPRAIELLAKAAAGAGADRRRGKWDKSWLVPTVLEVVDPHHRPFKKILLSVLEELDDMGEVEALLLMLAASLLHAAGQGLPRDIAERLTGSDSQLIRASNILDQELENRLDMKTNAATDSGLRYVTHGAAVSDGFVRVAAEDSHLRRHLHAICRRLPQLMKLEYTELAALREDRFELLDLTARYLMELRKDPELAVPLLESWVELAPIAFPTFDRLGNAYSLWLRKMLEHGEMEAAELLNLVTRSRASFERSLIVARDVLTRAMIPGPYRDFDLGKHERITYNSWAVLELAVGSNNRPPLGSEDNLLRAVFLTLLSMEGGDTHQTTVSTGLLAKALVRLGQFEPAAAVLS